MADKDILLGPIMKKIWENDDELYNFYIEDEDFRLDINKYDNLHESGSQF